MIESLPRREREIFEIVCGLGEATASAIRSAMTDPPSDSAVRALLSRLVGRGILTHRTDGQAYIYAPAASTDVVAANALQKVVRTFFQGSAASAAMALLGAGAKLEQAEIETLQQMIDQAKREVE